MPIPVLRPQVDAAAPVTPTIPAYPTYRLELALTNTPLDASPTYTDFSDRLRAFSTERGRSYEFDRMEAGSAETILDNRDAALDVENTSSPYYPLKHTRQMRVGATYGTSFPLFRGVTEGYPLTYPAYGYDAVSRVSAVDLFLALSIFKFAPGTIFSEQTSGERVWAVLSTAGIPAALTAIDTGQTTIAVSDDLGGTTALEHINLITETEFGRFFVSRSGIFTFNERHQELFDYLIADPEGTFVNIPLYTGTAGELPYRLTGDISPTEERLFNRVRITLPTEEVIEVYDQDSIDDHFERVYERTLPFADLNEASDAAQFLLNRLSTPLLRIPALEVYGATDPETMWPILLGMEIGQRFEFQYHPLGDSGSADSWLFPSSSTYPGSTTYPAPGGLITKGVILDRVRHSVEPMQHVVQVELTPGLTTGYWILGRAGFSELGSTTVLAY